MQIRKGLCAATVAVGMMVMAGSARADYNGVGWIVSQATANSATLANANAQSGNTNKVTFTTNALDFSSYGNLANTGNPSLDNQIGNFLGSLGHVTGSPVYSGSATSTTPLNNGGNAVLFEFTGTASFTNGQAFTVAHDDGVQFYVGCTGAACTAANLILNDPGPTSPTTTPFTYTGPTGNLAFTFVYGECCSDPAVLETTLVPAGVPEPGSIMLLGTVLVGIAAALRKKLA